MREQEDRDISNAEQSWINEPNAIGEEELPSGIEKTDKQEWDYTSRRTQKDSIWKRIRDWGTKEWGY